LPADHQARAVWAFVQSIDLQGLYAQIRAVEGSVGRAPIDPAILMSLWLYATLDGVARRANSTGCATVTMPTAGCAAGWV